MEYVKTDLGDFKKANVQYLLEQNVLVADTKSQAYRAKNLEISRSEFNTPVQMYSLFRLVVEDIIETLSVKDIDAIVDIMREGSYENKQYPAVKNIVTSGIPLVLKCYEKQNHRKGKKTNKKDEDFDY